MKTLFATLILLLTLQAQGQFPIVENYVDPTSGEGLSGWNGPLADLRGKLDKDKNYAVAIFHKPVNAFLFQKMFWFKNTLIAAQKGLKADSHGKLGHFQVAWRCQVPGGSPIEGLTGQSGEQDYQGIKMLTELGYGMSILFANFTDGFLQSSIASEQRIAFKEDGYGFNWVAFEISQDDCEQGLFYLSEYIRAKAYRNFSFVKDPNKLEGGGCTSFASELLFQFGAFRSTLIDAWRTKFGVPKAYLANPKASTLPDNTDLPNWLNQDRFTRRKANLFTMAYLPSFASKKNQVEADMYDSELILYTIQSIINRAHQERPDKFPKNFKPLQRKAYGLKKEKSGRIAPGGSKGYIIVDKDLDFAYERLYNYVHHKNIKVPRFKYTHLNGEPGLIFKKAAW